MCGVVTNWSSAQKAVEAASSGMLFRENERPTRPELIDQGKQLKGSWRAWEFEIDEKKLRQFLKASEYHF